MFFLEQINEQYWVASFLQFQEAWANFRRTGYPELETGELTPRRALPIRFMYGSNELNYNQQNVEEAIDRLTLSPFSQDEKNSPWSKIWVVAGTGKPY